MPLSSPFNTSAYFQLICYFEHTCRLVPRLVSRAMHESDDSFPIAKFVTGMIYDSLHALLPMLCCVFYTCIVIHWDTPPITNFATAPMLLSAVQPQFCDRFWELSHVAYRQ